MLLRLGGAQNGRGCRRWMGGGGGKRRGTEGRRRVPARSGGLGNGVAADGESLAATRSVSPQRLWALLFSGLPLVNRDTSHTVQMQEETKSALT